MRMKVVTLALQGGGSHGAFTWGVLDRLLEDERLEIEGISGASAGAMNAVALAHGFTVGGRDGARQALRDFWQSVASKTPFQYPPEGFGDPLQGGHHPAFSAFLSMARFFSPYQLNPFDINPLRDLLAGQIDFDRLRSKCGIKLFIAATQVSTGMLRLFPTQQITLEVLLASACLPSLHHAIEIEGEDYWDGGLTANPPLYPLLHGCRTHDILAVLLHPCRRPATPKTADDIWQRLTEISFSSTFFTELQGLALAKREAEQSWFAFGRLEKRMRRLNMHVIDSQQFMSELSTQSKLNTHPEFITALHDEGRARTGVWLEQNFDHIGTRGSFDLAQLLR